MAFGALAFPWFVYSAAGALSAWGNGSLFRLPEVAKDAAHLAYYAALNRDGWQRCTAGYAVFSKTLPPPTSGFSLEGRLVLPGLKVGGVSSVARPSARRRVRGGGADELSITFQKEHVESHVDRILATERELTEKFDQISRQTIHEIRGINSGLYHAAYELDQTLERSFAPGRQLELAGNIVAFSELLSARMDLVDFFFEESFNDNDFSRVDVYRKFHNLVRSFKMRAMRNRVEISLRGESFKATYGPPRLLELIAYLLIDAVKYSPGGEKVDVEVHDVRGSVQVTVTNIGPRVEEDEAQRIFQQDVRGQLARRSGVGGSGIGLFVLRKLVEDGFLGQVTLLPGAHQYDRDGIPYDRITFFLQLPAD